MAQWDSVIRSFILRNPELFKGEKGEPGSVILVSADVDVDGNLTLTLSNSVILGPWSVKGIKGDPGDNGDPVGVIDLVYPVGSIYISVASTNPGTLFGVGTWVAFGTGRVLVGLDASQTEFNTVEKTGGEKTHTDSVAEMPSHAHTQGASTVLWGGGSGGGLGGGGFPIALGGTTLAAGSNTAHNNLQPYIWAGCG